MRTVNIHSHVVLPEFIGAAGKYGPSFESTEDGFILKVGTYTLATKTREQQEMVRRGEKIDPQAWLAKVADPQVRLREMDEKGLDVMGVTTSPLFYLYSAEPEIAVPYARVTNSALAKYCSADDRRLFFLAALPMQDLRAAKEEVIRAVDELGAKGVNLGASDFAGRELDDEALFPLWAEMERRGVPLCIHPSLEVLSRPDQPTVNRPYQLQAVLEYPYQESLAFATLVFGGVFDQFPELKVYITHGGGMIPYHFGRLEAFSSVNGSKARRPIREYLKNFYFDIHIHDLVARRFLVEWMGADNLMVGDNYAGIDSTDGLKLLRELNLPGEDEAKIAGENAFRVFNLQD